ncbi:hypothetical protein [Kordiimonas aquimaris]|uniref:hypothetical protein n=1 Tax=Kordiimonas aquimaris TaxID=707591 RepID=UPI0021CEC7E3|nr:hypothetical protein [Kordiimonas aquimaris]
MSATFSTEFVLAVFYIVFLSQIYFASIHYPQKLVRRVAYILDNFPPEEYPNLYPSVGDGFVGRANRKLGLYSGVNYAIAVFGLVILGFMWASGYEPALKGGDEVYVMLYFFLQVIPFLVVSLQDFKHTKKLRERFAQRVRTAELKPRQLFDFVSPFLVGFAVLSYIAMLVFNLSYDYENQSQQMNMYLSLGLITLVNLAYVFVIAHFVKGVKLDPYKDGKDQSKQIESMAKSLTISSIMISVFLIVAEAADRYDIEVFDPAVSSFYMQLCLILGVGLTMRIDKVENMNFDVYKEDVAA